MEAEEGRSTHCSGASLRCEVICACKEIKIQEFSIWLALHGPRYRVHINRYQGLYSMAVLLNLKSSVLLSKAFEVLLFSKSFKKLCSPGW